MAVERAKILAGCYRKADAADPEVYAGAVAAVLSEYSPDIVQQVTDPRSGLPSSSQWLPTVKEVRDACEAIDGQRRRIAAMAAREEEQLVERRKFEETKKTKPTYDDLKAKYGENWGLQTPTAESEEIKEARKAMQQQANRAAFEAECNSAGMPLNSTASPSLVAILKAGLG